MIALTEPLLQAYGIVGIVATTGFIYYTSGGDAPRKPENIILLGFVWCATLLIWPVFIGIGLVGYGLKALMDADLNLDKKTTEGDAEST